MNAIDRVFAGLKANNKTALMPFLTAGDPSLAFTEQALPALMASGASLIEVGVPFSDPVADGPVIQASYTRALATGFTINGLFTSIQRITTAHSTVPLVAMASYSLIFKRGLEAFVRDAQLAGFSGAVVPDLPAEEASELAEIARSRDFKLILLVSPTTTPERAAKIVSLCSGFVYVVSVVGITGTQTAAKGDLASLIARLRTLTDLPLCIGFGVSTPEQVRELSPLADGIIVGSALVKCLSQPQPLEALKSLTASLAAAC